MSYTITTFSTTASYYYFNIKNYIRMHYLYEHFTSSSGGALHELWPTRKN
ncbi:hypothetical protein MtrunA17_Chr8g0337171 [Medicago truncatula]|uniref:Transmembrane protein n=1 Tax=Medicago truncatula TaxID=3880 RepID=A0A396GAP1_MEDTR|nr:hypothetical protein MtrunA17_Chr8g0337171 [Medicago truncatula]